jgi:hypothetical protein
MVVCLSCGLGNIASKKFPNTTRLRKNAKKRADKTSGRKRPRPDDLDGTTSLWENLNGDRCGSDGYDSSCNQNGSSNKEAKETSPPKKKIKTYSKSVLKKNKESQCATEQSTHNFPKNVPVESKDHSIGNHSKDGSTFCLPATPPKIRQLSSQSPTTLPGKSPVVSTAATQTKS